MKEWSLSDTELKASLVQVWDQSEQRQIVRLSSSGSYKAYIYITF